VKNGVISTSKKQYCDLEFDLREHVLVTDWFGSFEEHCIDMLSERCGDWFGTGTSEADIEDLMLSNVKVHRDGKTFSIRTDIGSGSGMKIQYADQCIAYDITGNPVGLGTIVAGTTVVPLLLLKCIRLAGTFGVDIQMTQVVVVEEQKCQIEMSDGIEGMGVGEKVEVEEVEEGEEEKKVAVSDQIATNQSDDLVEEVVQTVVNTENIPLPNPEEEATDGSPPVSRADDEIELDSIMTVANPDHIGNSTQETISLSESPPTSPASSASQTDPIRVVDLNIDDITETAPIELMESKEVRLKMYKEAKRRAIVARKRAIEEIMRARNIKMEFMLDDEVDSDSDVDSDFESVYGDEEME
jgi:hypothetical protein